MQIFPSIMFLTLNGLREDIIWKVEHQRNFCRLSYLDNAIELTFHIISTLSALGDVDCGNCKKSSSAYEPVCAVGEQDWFRYIIYHILINYITFLICALAKPALDKK